MCTWSDSVWKVVEGESVNILNNHLFYNILWKILVSGRKITFPKYVAFAEVLCCLEILSLADNPELGSLFFQPPSFVKREASHQS